MMQRARFNCPLGGQPLIVVYDESKSTFYVAPDRDQRETGLTDFWKLRLGEYGRGVKFALGDVRVLLTLNGVDGAALDFEGV